METMEKTEKNVHQGRNLSRIRRSKDMKQEALAPLVGLSQQAVSAYEQRAVIPDDILEKFSKALNCPVDLIKGMEDDPMSIIIENNTFENNDKVSNIGNYNVEDNSVNHFNPIDKIAELFERLLEKEQEKIALLEQLLKEKK